MANDSQSFDLGKLDQWVRETLANQHASNTRRGYVSDCRIFAAWCQAHGLVPLPATPENVARFLTVESHTGSSAATIVRRRAAIRYLHETAGHVSPTEHPLVRQVMMGINRTLDTTPKQKAPIIDRDLLAMLQHIDTTSLAGKRDRALLLVGFSGAFRRSELVGIHVDHLTWNDRGVSVLIPRSMTDQEGRGQTVAIFNGRQFRPADALHDWMAAAGITTGPVFRAMKSNGQPRAAAMSDHAAVEIIKRYAQAAGLDPATVAGHSLRAGFVTTAVMHNANPQRIMKVTRDKSIDSLKDKVRFADGFEDHPGESFL